MAVAIQDLVADFDRIKFRQLILSATATSIVAPDPTRYLLIFSLASGTVTVNTQPFTGTTSGIVMPPVGTLVTFFFRDHGIMTTSEWYGLVAGAGTLNVWEGFYKPRQDR